MMYGITTLVLVTAQRLDILIAFPRHQVMTKGLEFYVISNRDRRQLVFPLNDN